MKIVTFSEIKNGNYVFDVVEFEEADAKITSGFRPTEYGTEPYPTLRITKYKVVGQIPAEEVPVDNRMECGVTLVRGAMESVTFTCFRMAV